MPVPHVSPDRSRAGFTIIELVLALALSILVLLAVGMNFLDFSRAFSSMAKIMHSRTRAQTIADRVVSEAFGAQLTSITPVNPVNSPWVSFKKITGVNADGSPAFGNPIYIELFPDETNITDNIDNDGDGLVDEGGIRTWVDLPPHGPTPVDDPVVILTGKVKKQGLKFTQDGSYLKIDMTLQEVIETGITKDTAILAGVKIRN